jgi:hypothetical protein
LSYKEGWENRLTAILAAVLDQHTGFASALFESVQLPVGDHYEAYIEEWVTEDRRVDMQVLGKDERGVVVAQIWSEHKRAGGAFGTNQREDYLNALEHEPGVGKLLTIVAEIRADETPEDADSEQPAEHENGEVFGSRPGEPSQKDSRWWGMTWQLIAELADVSGQRFTDPWGGRGWADRALNPAAPAAQRALYELLWYLDQEGYAVVSPLTIDHVQAIKNSADTFDVTTTLLARTADQMRPLVPDGEPVWDDGLHGYAQDFETPANAWPARVDGAIELLIWDNDGWIDTPTGQPCVAVGVSIEPEWHRPLSQLPDWIHRVHAAGFSFTRYKDWLCCYATMPLREVVDKGGAGLVDQCNYIASWATPLAMRLLSAEFDPGPLEPPVKSPAARRRGVQADDQGDGETP